MLLKLFLTLAATYVISAIYSSRIDSDPWHHSVKFQALLHTVVIVSFWSCAVLYLYGVWTRL